MKMDNSNNNNKSKNQNQSSCSSSLDSGFESTTNSQSQLSNNNNSLTNSKPQSPSLLSSSVSSSSTTLSINDNLFNTFDDINKSIDSSSELPKLAMAIQENQKFIENLDCLIKTINVNFDLNSLDDEKNNEKNKQINNDDDEKNNSTIDQKHLTSSSNPFYLERRNSSQWPIGINHFGSHYNNNQNHQRFNTNTNNDKMSNLYSKSAPMSNDWFNDDIINYDNNNNNDEKLSIIKEWQLKNDSDSSSLLNPNANHFSPSSSKKNIYCDRPKVFATDSITRKLSDKIDKGALFVLDETFFDCKEQQTYSFRQMMTDNNNYNYGEPHEIEYNSYNLSQSIIPNAEKSILKNIETSSTFNDNNIKKSQLQSDDLSFSFDNVFGKKCSNSKIHNESINNDSIDCFNNDDDDDNNKDKKFDDVCIEKMSKHKIKDEKSLLSTENMNQSLFGNIHGLSTLINQPSVLESTRSNLIPPITSSISMPTSYPVTSNSVFAMSLQQYQRNSSNSNAAIACFNDELEARARKHREEASRIDQCQSIFAINKFEYKIQSTGTYSVKVFLGGVPWNMNNEEMLEEFRQFGAISVQRPGIEVRPSRSCRDLSKAGYLFLIFDESKSVERLVSVCKIVFDNEGSKFIYTLQSKLSKKIKDVEIIPWDKRDSSYYRHGYLRHDDNNERSLIDDNRKVFLGALHGMLNSQSIFEVLQEIFGPVDYVILETDHYDYPKGFGRAKFTTSTAYQRAINARFVKVLSIRFEKTIQIDPYLEDRKCSQCHIENGPVFCFECEHYYCRNCWTMKHNDSGKNKHKILMKNVQKSINNVTSTTTTIADSTTNNPSNTDTNSK